MAAQRGILMSSWALGLLGLIVSAHLVSVAHSVFQCTDAIPKVTPCGPFVLGSGPDKPSEECCAGLQDLDKLAAASQPDRKAICLCMKQAIATFPIDLTRINQLPKLCHLSLNIPISGDVDCDKV